MRRDAVKLISFRGVGTAIRFAGLAYFARVLGAEVLGAYFLFRAMYWFLRVPSDFGLSDAVQKRISEGQSSDAVTTTGALLKLVPLAVVGGFVYVVRGQINGYVGLNVAILYFPLLLVEEYGRLSVAVLRGKLRIGETATIELARHVAWVGAGVLLTIGGYEVMSLIYASIASAIVVLLIGGWKVDVGIRTPSRRIGRQLVSFSKFRFVTTVGDRFYNWMDIVVIGFFLTHTHVGVYEVAWQVTTVVSLLSYALAATIFPHISAWDADGRRDELERLIPRAITPLLAVAIPAFFGVIVLGELILSITFGTSYVLASSALVLLMGEKILRAAHVIFGRALEGIDKPNLAARSTVLSLSVNAILNVVLVWKFGLIGAAIATATASALDMLVHVRYVSRFVDIRIPYRELGWCIVASLGMSGIVSGVKTLVVIDTFAELVIAILLGVTVYVTLLLPFDPLRQRIAVTVGEIRP